MAITAAATQVLKAAAPVVINALVDAGADVTKTKLTDAVKKLPGDRPAPGLQVAVPETK